MLFGGTYLDEQFVEFAILGHLANVLGDLHRTVLRPTHATEVSALERVLR